ncbi:MAG: hypothetical protein ACE5GQ_03400 [Nitrospinales bacterium]
MKRVCTLKLNLLAIALLGIGILVSGTAVAGDAGKPVPKASDDASIKLVSPAIAVPTVATILQDFNGVPLAGHTCNVTHKDGKETPDVQVGTNGSVGIQVNQTGILLCKKGETVFAARLVNHQGGTLTMVPFNLSVGLIDVYRESIRGLPQQSVDIGNIGLGGVWDQ